MCSARSSPTMRSRLRRSNRVKSDRQVTAATDSASCDKRQAEKNEGNQVNTRGYRQRERGFRWLLTVINGAAWVGGREPRSEACNSSTGCSCRVRMHLMENVSGARAATFFLTLGESSKPFIKSYQQKKPSLSRTRSIVVLSFLRCPKK